MPRILLLSLADPVTDRRTHNFERFFLEHGWSCETLSLPLKHRSGPRKFLEYHRALTHELVSQKRRVKTDVVVACDLFSLGPAARMKKSRRTRRLIYDAREVYTELPTVAHKPLAKAFWKRVERRSIDKADLMLVTGPLDADAIRRAQSGIPRTVLVRNLPWREDRLQRDRSVLKGFGLNEALPVFVYVGGLQVGRGLSALVKAMSQVPAQLLLIGGGTLENSLRDLVNRLGLDDRVRFTGPLPSGQALSVVAACDAGVSLIEPLSESYQLALPSKIFEYMMAGLPVLCSRLTQVEMLFAKEEWIEFVDVGDASEIVRGLEGLIGKMGRPDLIQQEQQLASSQYHFEADAEQMMEILESYRL